MQIRTEQSRQLSDRINKLRSEYNVSSRVAEEYCLMAAATIKKNVDGYFQLNKKSPVFYRQKDLDKLIEKSLRHLDKCQAAK